MMGAAPRDRAPSSRPLICAILVRPRPASHDRNRAAGQERVCQRAHQWQRADVRRGRGPWEGCYPARRPEAGRAAARLEAAVMQRCRCARAGVLAVAHACVLADRRPACAHSPVGGCLRNEGVSAAWLAVALHTSARVTGHTPIPPSMPRAWSETCGSRGVPAQLHTTALVLAYLDPRPDWAASEDRGRS